MGREVVKLIILASSRECYLLQESVTKSNS